MGDALVDQLLKAGMVRNISDLYRLTSDQLLTLERMGKRSAAKIITNVDHSRSQPLPRLIYGLGIPFVGERTAQLLTARVMRYFGLAYLGQRYGHSTAQFLLKHGLALGVAGFGLAAIVAVGLRLYQEHRVGLGEPE